MNLVDALTSHARNRPSARAIVDGERGVTYRELHALVGAAALRLSRAGLGAGDPVGVAVNDPIDHLVILHALAWIGAIIVSLPISSTAAERAELATIFELRAIIAEAGAEPVAAVPVIGIDPSWRRASDDTFPSPVDGGARPLLIVTTSGTTGESRGVLISHAQMIARLRANAASFGVCAADRYLSVVSVSLNVGRTFCLLALHLGATAIIHAMGQSVEQSLAAIARDRITWMFLVPPQLRQLLAHDGPPGLLLPTVRVLNTGGGLLGREERIAIRERLTPHLYESYGANEVSLLAVATPEDQILRPDAVGRIIAGVEAEIVDDDDRPVPPGGTGHIRLRGRGFPTGYHRDPEASAAAFRDRWFYPGDIAVIDEQGYVHLRGRRDDRINHAGLKVYPGEIESCLLEHPAVVEAAVVAAPAPEVQEVPVAFVVIRSTVPESDLIAFCRQRLAKYKVPRRVFHISMLPRNDAGKVVKAVLLDALGRMRASGATE